MPPYDLDPSRRRPPRSQRSLLWEANTLLATPVAKLFGALGVAPGQLSIQSVVLTVVGLLRMATGTWSHVVQGSLIVYGALLVDRADHLVAEASGRPRAWGAFLGLVADRLVEALLVVGLCVLLVLGVSDVPSLLPPAWTPLPTTGAVVVGAGALAAMFLWRLVVSYSDVLSLRSHLLAARRLPGPSAMPRMPQGVERLNRVFDRDLLVLAWLVGAVFLQLQLTLWVLLAAHVCALLESVVLFWQRSKDPEPTASRVLAVDYP